MRISFVLPLLAVLALPLPVMAQDIFAPLRDMVEDITKPPAQTPPRRVTPRPTVSDEVAPVPQQRPADLGGPEAPVVAQPVKPEVPEVAKPVPPVVPSAEPELPAPRPDEPVEAPKSEPTEPVVAEPEKPAVPERVFQTACPAMLEGQVEATALPPISEGQCKAQSPLSVSGVLVNGRMVPFNAEAVTDCGMASALPGWISDVDGYVQAHDNTRVESVIVGTGYMCRNVNNAAEGNLSFHAFADALDVVGFKLEDGRTVTVEEGWTGTEAQGSQIIKFAHDAACGHFTTTLGPEANAQHHDHIHVDLGCHGKTCTARLCE